MGITDKTDTCLFFQDVVSMNDPTGLEQQQTRPQHEENNEEVDADDKLSLAFFELANVSSVGYRIELDSMQRKRKKIFKKTKNTTEAINVIIKQDINACGNHTGGIVWETSYLLLNFLLSQQKLLGKTLEVGAGCGMLGIALGASGWSKRVVLTETPEAMSNLQQNVIQNSSILCKKKKNHETSQDDNEEEPTKQVAVVRQLNWLHMEDDVAAYPKDLKPHSFDTIVGTDVVFTPMLVEPLLKTLRFMAHSGTIVYLCLQVRCTDSHRLLLEKAKQYEWGITEISQDLDSIPACVWGLQMECRLLRFATLTGNENTNHRDDNEHKRKKRKMF